MFVKKNHFFLQISFCSKDLKFVRKVIQGSTHVTGDDFTGVSGTPKTKKR